MTRITVVIDSHTEGVHLGMNLAGGRVVAAMEGDHSDCLERLAHVRNIISCYWKPSTMGASVERQKLMEALDARLSRNTP